MLVEVTMVSTKGNHFAELACHRHSRDQLLHAEPLEVVEVHFDWTVSFYLAHLVRPDEMHIDQLLTVCKQEP